MLRVRCSAEFPQQFARCDFNAVQESVVTAKEHPVFPASRRQTNWCFCISGPDFGTRIRVEGDKFVLVIESHQQPAIHHDRFELPIVGHQIQVQRIVPGLLSGREFPFPNQIELIGQSIGRRSRSSGIESPHWPVIRPRIAYANAERTDPDQGQANKKLTCHSKQHIFQRFQFGNL